jgi:hypothetical protein
MIRADSISQQYTWNVVTQGDQTLSVEGCDRRINMIWWEAMRNTKLRFDAARSVCLRRDDIEEFLRRVLQKLGVRDNELDAFVHYWKEVFMHDYDPKNCPFFLVQPIHSSDVENYLPKMQISGKDASSFALERFYFRFQPLAYSFPGAIDAESYIDEMMPRQFGANAVIDLGGEVDQSPDMQKDFKWPGYASFKDAFIESYIYA